MVWLKAAPYVIVGLLVAALSGAALWYRGEAAQAETERVRVETQNTGLLKIVADQGATIARLASQQQIDEKLITRVTSTLEAIQMDAAKTSQAVTDLKETDPNARQYLDTTIPDGVRRLLNNPGSSAGP